MRTYDRRTIIYHWLSAALVLALWILGQTIDWFPRGDARVYARSTHILLGVLLTLTLIFRIRWRLTAGEKLPLAVDGVQGKAAVGVHHVLYLLVTAIVVIGLACVWIRGDNIFGLFKVPVFDTENKELRHQAVGLHGLLANGLLLLSVLHAAAAVWHQYIHKDGVLTRMVPRLGQRNAR